MAVAELPAIPFLIRARAHAEKNPDKPAIVDGRTGKEHTYADLLRDAAAFREQLLSNSAPGTTDLAEARVAALVPNGYSWVVAQWATWAAGGFYVPILHTHPVAEMRYIVENAEAQVLVVHRSLEGKGRELAEKAGVGHIVIIDEDFRPQTGSGGIPTISSLQFDTDRASFMLYTSGTTGKPKGVVMTHKSLTAQAESMTECWHWKESDKVLHVLPLHHIHGVSNVLLTALYNGATVEFMPKFDAPAIWARWQDARQDLTLFMAVPTIYSRLIEIYDAMKPEEQARATAACKQFRLMVSGSAPLPSPLKERWRQISGGQVLLERYGMTETGMIISCGMDEGHRIDGHVGLPMPGMSVRLWDPEAGRDVSDQLEAPGEIQIRGDLVFKGYWRLPEVTKKEFTEDGWFKSGDIGIRTKETGFYRIQGRSSVDIIKSGGEKVSAIEVERALLSLPFIKDASVVGVEDPRWGEVVGCVIVLSDKDKQLELKELRDALRSELANYKIPQKMKIYDTEIPRNAMMKVDKKSLVKVAFPTAASN